MKCTDAQAKLLDLLYEELPETEQSAVCEHLAACGSCRSRWDELVEARNLLNRADTESISPRIDVLGISRRSTRRAERATVRWRRIAAAAGVVAAAIVCAMFAGLRVEAHRSRVALAWGPPEPVQAAEVPRFEDPWPVLSDQAERLRNVEELTGLAIRDFLQSDRSRTAQITQLQEQVELLQRGHALQFARLQNQSDERWRLILNELSTGHDDDRFVQRLLGRVESPDSRRVRSLE